MDRFFILASAFDQQVKAATEGKRFETRDLVLGTTIVLIIGLALFLIVYLRSRRKSDQIDQERLSQIAKSSRDSAEGGRRRKRRRRRGHRPRNPSLEETGGLPPPRPDDQLPKY